MKLNEGERVRMNETFPSQLNRLDNERLKGYKTLLDFYYGLQWQGRERWGERRLIFNYAKVFIEKITSYLMTGISYAVEPMKDSNKAKEKAGKAIAALYRVYEDNYLEQLDLETEIDCAVLGDACYKVIWDANEKKVRVTAPDVQGIYAWCSGDDISRVWRVASRYNLGAVIVEEESGEGEEIISLQVTANAAESGEGDESVSLLAAADTAEDSGGGIETSHLNVGEIIDKVSSDSGDGFDITAVIFTEIVLPETGGGADVVSTRALKLEEDGFGVETGERTSVWIVADNGSGIEAAAVIPVFGANDTGLGAELSILFKGAQSSDIGYGVDALKALIGAAGLSPNMRLPKGSGKVKMASKKARMPSKGVNI
jgi:hypothetical protein